jgi:hypothetical protein
MSGMDFWSHRVARSRKHAPDSVRPRRRGPPGSEEFACGCEYVRATGLKGLAGRRYSKRDPTSTLVATCRPRGNVDVYTAWALYYSLHASLGTPLANRATTQPNPGSPQESFRFSDGRICLGTPRRSEASRGDGSGDASRPRKDSTVAV